MGDQSLLKNVKSNVAVMIFTVAVRFFAVPVYLSKLGPEAVGLISIYISIQALLVFFDLGLASAFNREVAHLGSANKEEIANLGLSLERFYPLMGIGLGSIIGILGGSFGAQWLTGEVASAREIKTIFALYGATFAVTWTGQLYQQGISGLQEFGALNRIRAWGVVLDVGGSIAIVYVFQITSLYFVWQLCAAGIATALYRRKFWALAGKFAVSNTEHWTRIRKLLQVSLGLNAYAVLSMVFMQIDRIFISTYCSLADVGIYGMATTFPMAMLYLVYPITSASYPKFSSLVAQESDKKTLLDYFCRGTTLITLVVVFATSAFTILAEPITILWLRKVETAETVAGLSRILILGSVVQGLVALPIIYLLANRQAWRASASFGVGLLSYVAALTALVPIYGVSGAALAWVIANISVLVSITYALRSVLPVKTFHRWITQCLGAPIVAMLGLLTAYESATEILAHRGFQTTLLPLVAFVFLFILLGVLPGRPTMQECRRAFQRSAVRDRAG